MKDQNVLYSKGKNDECKTPRYAVLPIIEYIPINKIVWCPFDTKESEFVKVLKENKVKVVHSHIADGQDFYTYEPKHWDILISNPPFTNKKFIFERALNFGKPFALLMSLTWMNDSAPAILFKDKDLQILKFDKRIQFNNIKKITFSSAYYCYKFLPKQIIMRELEVTK